MHMAVYQWSGKIITLTNTAEGVTRYMLQYLAVLIDLAYNYSIAIKAEMYRTTVYKTNQSIAHATEWRRESANN